MATESKPLKKQETDKTQAKKSKRKLFVLDTNVLLLDPRALWQFNDNDIAIPITVLEEIDQFKHGSDSINLNARETARELDQLAGLGRLSEDGVPLGKGLGKLRVLVGQQSHPKVTSNFSQDHPDHRILSAALSEQEKDRNRAVILVSKDVALRLKARSLDLNAADYEKDKAPDLDELYTGRTVLDNIDNALIDKLLQEPFSIPLDGLDITELYPNAYIVLQGSNKSVLARYNASEKKIIRVEKREAFGIHPRNSEQTFALDALTNPEIQLVTLSGKAGTGKTLLALAGALEVRRQYHQIFLARPIIALSDRDIGFLPGDIKEKIDPYMQPLWDNLAVIRDHNKEENKGKDSIKSMLDNNKLLISPLAYIRGRSLHHIYFIVDEAQNLNAHEVKTIITRAGEGTKIVFTGDPEQIDSPYLDSRSNGLTRLIDRMKGQEIFAHVTLEKGERSPLSDLAAEVL